MRLIEKLHGHYVYNRRVEVLSRILAELVPTNAHLLDVGCGDGLISSLIQQRRSDVVIEGIDVLLRPRTFINVSEFDGQHLPYADKTVDSVLFVDVLHHTDDPAVLLREAVRVAKQCVLIKDHLLQGLLAGPTLRFMDWIGNAHHGVVLPYNYWPEQRWHDAFNKTNLQLGKCEKDLMLYPWWASWWFDRSLHFIARLDVSCSA